jgi:nicotinamide mononucleotide transporter
LFGLGFLFLIIKEKIIAWPIGIIASLINIYLLINVKLYSESILYSFYVVAGIYGWYNWGRSKEPLKVIKKSIKYHLIFILIGIFAASGLGYLFDNYTDAEKSYWDSFSTVFALIATYLEARKELNAWIYWIILNSYTVYLYYSVDLNFRSIEMFIYAIFSFVGYLAWRRSYKSS